MNRLPAPDGIRAGRLHAAVFLQGTSLLALEIVLSRVLSVIMWHHFASLVISLALLGMTVGAVVVYLLQESIKRRWQPFGFLSMAAALFGISSAVVYAFFWTLSSFPTVGYRFFNVFHQPYFEPFGSPATTGSYPLVLYMSVMFIVMAIPFFSGGTFITAVFSWYGPRAGSLYAADLLGAGFGCFAAVAILNVADGLTAVLIASLPALAVAVLLTGRGKPRKTAAILLLLMATVSAGSAYRPLARIMFVRGRFQPDILYEKWSATSRVVVYPLSGGQEEGSWGQSRRFSGAIPPQMGLVVDDTGYTTITAYPENGDLEFMRHNLIALPYCIRPESESLIIGPGGGRDILAALAMDAREVVAVEINPLVVEAVDSVFGDFSGRLYDRPGVRTHLAEGRNFLRRDRRRYDVLQASIVYGRLPPSAGAFTLSEDQLYTLESFREFMGRLKDDGLLSITRFIYEKRMLRLVSLGRAILDESGADQAGRHFFIAAERGLANILIKKKPFLPEEVDTLEEWCKEMGFRILYSPDGEKSAPFGEVIDSRDPGDASRRFRFDITPPTDDRPYFYYMVKPKDFWLTLVSGAGYEFEDRAIIIIRNAILIIGLLTMLLVILPLAGRNPGGADFGVCLGTLGYFGGIALGFITVEIVLLKTMILYLGFPVLSLCVVLASLLISAGLGSLASQRFFSRWTPISLAAVLLCVAAAVAVFPQASGVVLEATVASGLMMRIFMATLIIFPIGFCLGIPLPSGIQVLRKQEESLVPWAFGINGAFSVLGAMVALALTLNYGFSKTWLMAPAGYVLALACLAGLRKKHE